MMAAENTHRIKEWDIELRKSYMIHRNIDSLTPVIDEISCEHLYNISSPITDVFKKRFYLFNFPGRFWTFSWKYRSETAKVFAYQGVLPVTMEDRFVVDENIDNTGVSLYALFDGYDGAFSADYLAYNLMDTLRRKIIDFEKMPQNRDHNRYTNVHGKINYKKLLHDEIVAADKNLLKKLNATDRYRHGSSMVIAIIDHGKLFVANVGNSRAVMCNTQGNATRLTFDHRPNQPEERKRIEEAGGKVTLVDGYIHAVDGKLPVSRCMGDKYMKQAGKYVIANPHVFAYDLSKCKSKFILMATHGLWFVMDRLNRGVGDQKVVTQINENLGTDLLATMRNLTVYISKTSLRDDNQTLMIIRTCTKSQK